VKWYFYSSNKWEKENELQKIQTQTSKMVFYESNCLDQLKATKDPLIKLKGRIDFELFLQLLDEALYKEGKGIGGVRRRFISSCLRY